MPIYEYQCDACGSQRELILKHGEVARPTCAACRKRMRRVISKTAFILKGSGWYVTDYPSDARKQGAGGGETRRPRRRPGGRRSPARRRSRPPARRRSPLPRRKSRPAGNSRPAAAANSGKSGAKKKEVTLPLCHLIMTDSQSRASYL